MAECKACGREAGPNNCYCDRDCSDLVHAPVDDAVLRREYNRGFEEGFTQGRKHERANTIAWLQSDTRIGLTVRGKPFDFPVDKR